MGYMGTDGQDECENALFPAHTGKGVDRLLDTRLRLLPLKETLKLFLKSVSISIEVPVKGWGGTV